MINSLIKSLAALAVMAGPAVGHAADCHAALVLALDVSDSVDTQEADLQRTGLANALRDDAVRAAITPRLGLGAALMAFEWSDPRSQDVIVPWRLLQSDADIDAFAAQLETSPPPRVPGQTGIGGAMRFAAAAFADAPPCDRRLIDISGDGPGNTGVPPRAVKESGALADITINGLVIRNPELDSAQPPSRDPLPYYQKEVKHGPGAFVIVIDDFDDYEDAIRRKLLRELSPNFSSLR